MNSVKKMKWLDVNRNSLKFKNMHPKFHANVFIFYEVFFLFYMQLTLPTIKIDLNNRREIYGNIFFYASYLIQA